MCFALFLDMLKDPMEKSTPNELRETVEAVIAKVCAALEAEEITDISMLNFVVSDGDTLVCNFSHLFAS
jgi:hypothetical protein